MDSKFFELLKQMASDPKSRDEKLAEMDARVAGLANYVTENYPHDPGTAISAMALVLSEVIKAHGNPRTLTATLEALTMYTMVPINRYIDKEKMQPPKSTN